ncbi:MAG TPA: pyruvate:ferredoxin (flavodoxin) oxidoreductase [Gemmatimonadales bacterium]|nr:pyruvate:ferredoxin (flavodoxin) oxidoreductase [Gemmatimonadales bacterium]
MNPRIATLDGNEATALVAHRTNEVIAVYPITPSSTMGELADQWSAEGKTNLWGSVPAVVEMQSEGGAAGAIHGALQGGALATTFTASQGLLLMIPNLYKIAGELTPLALHVAARTIATHALSIFGDHSDVMAVRQTGVALLASASVQEAHDLALVAQAATLRSRIPMLHFFDGFRTSHEMQKVALLDDDDLRALLDDGLIAEHRRRALDPEHPVLRGTAQNPDAYFQAREACNPFYDACPGIVQELMNRLGARTGRRYGLFDYAGHPEADRVIVAMGSAVETIEQTSRRLNLDGDRVGVLKVRLYRPFDAAALIAVLPPTVRRIAVLDRTKEPGAPGEPLFLDVVAAIADGWSRRSPGSSLPTPLVVGGRYGLSSKEFTPAMARAVFAELARPEPKRRFTVGIVDDVTGLSLDWDRGFSIEPDDEVRAVFWGLGSDGTVGATKNTIKIIGEETPLHAQGYFVFDSKKAGAVTVSHLRFGPRPIHAPYLITSATFIACHQFDFLDKYDVLETAAPGATLLLNAPHAANEVWDRLPREMQETILSNRMRVFAIDAARVAKEAGLGGRINTVMQTCFFAVSGVLPRDQAISKIKEAIARTYGKRGAAVVERNFAAVDRTLAALAEIAVPGAVTATRRRPPIVAENAPDFVRRVTAVMMAGKGDLLPVSAFPVDGTWPTATSRWEKRNLADEIPVWDQELCIQCNWCALVCPHAAIRTKVYEPAALAGAPEGFRHVSWRGPDLKGQAYTVQVAPEDCTGCSLCAAVCPATDKADRTRKAIAMTPQPPIRERERTAWQFFLGLPEIDRTALTRVNAKTSQLYQPLFEFSGACAGCGETPYLKLLSQLFGDRAVIANATGCSSIFGGNLPTTPWTVDGAGRGPAWANSLFEDNAEFGFGLRLAIDARRDEARRLVSELTPLLGDQLAGRLANAGDRSEAGLAAGRRALVELRARLAGVSDPRAARLLDLADALLHRSVWLVGGDGWAYDIGYGGLDHVLAQERDVNVLVLDTEVYSNTGGQQSKATPLGAAAKFATAGKSTGKKDLGLEAMSYGHVYVARVALGADMNQTVRAFAEAESYPGPSLIIAYSPCIAQGYDLSHNLEQQQLSVKSGAWPLYRFDPRRTGEHLPPLQLDSKDPTVPLATYQRIETRFHTAERLDPARYARLMAQAEREVADRWAVYRYLAGLAIPESPPASASAGADEPTPERAEPLPVR